MVMGAEGVLVEQLAEQQVPRDQFGVVRDVPVQRRLAGLQLGGHPAQGQLSEPLGIRDPPASAASAPRPDWPPGWPRSAVC
jgi:hypothetical protein